MRPRISIWGSVRPSVRWSVTRFFRVRKNACFRLRQMDRGRGWWEEGEGRSHRHRQTKTRTHAHTHAHALATPKWATMYVPRCRGTHLTFGVTKLVTSWKGKLALLLRNILEQYEYLNKKKSSRSLSSSFHIKSFVESDLVKIKTFIHRSWGEARQLRWMMCLGLVV